MSDTTIDQKLKLVQQVRARYHEDQYDMSSRERLLYGRTSADSRLPQVSYRQEAPYDDVYGAPYGEPGIAPYSSLKVRFFIALLLLSMVVMMDKNDMKVAGIAADQVFQAISADYEEVLEAWAKAASQAREKE